MSGLIVKYTFFSFLNWVELSRQIHQYFSHYWWDSIDHLASDGYSQHRPESSRVWNIMLTLQGSQHMDKPHAVPTIVGVHVVSFPGEQP